MARCGDCNKFVSFEEAEPEVDSLDVDAEGNVTANVRIANQCGECGNDLREYTFEVSVDRSDECKGHTGEGHTLDIEETSSERTQRSVGKGRGTRTFYGFTVEYEIKCECDADKKDGERWSVSGTLSDDVQASGMDEC